MKEGETWVYPVRLKKGVEYSFSAACSRRTASLKCSLCDNHERLLCKSETGMNHLCAKLEEDGLCRFTIMREGRRYNSRPEKVTITVKKP